MLARLFLLLGILIAFAAMGVAGYMGLWKAVLQVLFLYWAGLKLDEVDEFEHDASVHSSNWFLKVYHWKPLQKLIHFRQNRVGEVYKGQALKAIPALIMFVVILGWIIAAITLLFQDWHEVVAHEIKEMLVLACVVGCYALSLLAAYGHYSRLAEKADDVFAEDDPPDNGEEEDIVGVGYRMMGKAWRHYSDMFDARLSHFALVSAACIVAVLCYVSGVVVHAKFPIPELESIRGWHF